MPPLVNTTPTCCYIHTHTINRQSVGHVALTTDTLSVNEKHKHLNVDNNNNTKAGIPTAEPQQHQHQFQQQHKRNHIKKEMQM